jgi:hypothetical protein
MSIKIYFAGSIRGGRDSAADYQVIIKHLQQIGTVLTEHIADENMIAEEINLTDEQIHDRDIDWLNLSHCIVAEVTQPSMGVGYELASAMFLNKPVLCLFNKSKGKKLSAMISGQKYFHVVNYDKINEALEKIREYFNNFESKQSRS